MSGTINNLGERKDGIAWPETVTPDDAGILANAPKVSVEIVSKHLLVTGLAITTWRVLAAGFVEQEAEDAYEQAMADAEQQLAAGQQPVCTLPLHLQFPAA